MKLNGMGLTQRSFGLTLRLDWDNDRHHQVSLGDGGKFEVLRGLYRLLKMVESDVRLEAEQEGGE